MLASRLRILPTDLVLINIKRKYNEQVCFNGVVLFPFVSCAPNRKRHFRKQNFSEQPKANVGCCSDIIAFARRNYLFFLRQTKAILNLSRLYQIIFQKYATKANIISANLSYYLIYNLLLCVSNTPK